LWICARTVIAAVFGAGPSRGVIAGKSTRTAVKYTQTSLATKETFIHDQIQKNVPDSENDMIAGKKDENQVLKKKVLDATFPDL
jgi:hypothetical protein